MKKALLILGVVFLVLIVGFVSMLIWAQRSGSQHQAKFFQALQSGDPKQVEALFHPALKDEVDEPVLAAWMQAVQTHLGAFQGMSKTNFSTSTKSTGDGWFTESKGVVHFEKGQADSELVFRDQELVKFHVSSEKIPADWFKGPVGTALYQERGKQFLTQFLNSQVDAAYKMLHENMKKKVSADDFKTMIERIAGKAGAMKSIAVASETPEEGGTSLRIFYKVQCENAALNANVKFEFVGMKGHLLGFHVTEE